MIELRYQYMTLLMDKVSIMYSVPATDKQKTFDLVKPAGVIFNL